MKITLPHIAASVRPDAVPIRCLIHDEFRQPSGQLNKIAVYRIVGLRGRWEEKVRMCARQRRLGRSGWQMVKRDDINVVRRTALYGFDVFHKTAVEPLKTVVQPDRIEIVPEP